MDTKSDFKTDFPGKLFGHQHQEDLKRQSLEEGKIELDALANLTGFPKEFIQSELSLSSDREVSMKELRISMLHFLDTNLGEFK